MKEIQTWHERAMAHPDHQSGMVSEDMIRARMAEEIADLRAEVERLTRERDEARYFLEIFAHAHASNNAVPPHLEEQAREAMEAKP